VLIHPFKIPRSRDVDLRRVASLKVEQSVGDLDAGKTLWGFVEHKSADTNARMNILAAAVSREYIDDVLGRHFGDADRPVLVECAALAALRAHLALRSSVLGGEIVIDCAPDVISIFVLRNGAIESAHVVPANRPFDAVVNEIRRLMIFLQSKRRGASVEAVTCLGGAVAERLAAQLGRMFTVPVAACLAQPPAWIEPTDALPEDWTREWHRVIGLIELVRDADQTGINFLAGAARQRRLEPLLPALEKIRTAALAMALAGLLVGAVLIQRVTAERRETLVTRVIERGRDVAPELQRNQQVLSILRQYNAERYALSEVLFAFAESTPNGIVFDSLTMNPDGTISVVGTCKRYIDGQEFARQLNESDLFTLAQTVSLRREKDKVVFKTTFRLTPTARRIAK
jgi:hypothetical protein